MALLGALVVSTPAQALSDTGNGGQFVATSGRIMTGVAVKAGAWTTVQIAGKAGIPLQGAGAVVLNSTASKMTGVGQLNGRPDSVTPATLMLTYNGGDLGATSNSSTVATLQGKGEPLMRDNHRLHSIGTLLLAIGFALTAFGSWFNSWTTVGMNFGAAFVLWIGLAAGFGGLVVVATLVIVERFTPPGER
jgi:hypothetical protein